MFDDEYFKLHFTKKFKSKCIDLLLLEDYKNQGDDKFLNLPIDILKFLSILCMNNYNHAIYRRLSKSQQLYVLFKYFQEEYNQKSVFRLNRYAFKLKISSIEKLLKKCFKNWPNKLSDYEIPLVSSNRSNIIDIRLK